MGCCVSMVAGAGKRASPWRNGRYREADVQGSQMVPGRKKRTRAGSGGDKLALRVFDVVSFPSAQ
jgi:hypothetical protein